MEQLLCPQIVGREAELAAVHEAVDAAAAGAGRGTVLLGEAGAGKTRLLAAARDVARERGLVVLRGRVLESAGGPFDPVAEAVSGAVRAGWLRGAALGQARILLDSLAVDNGPDRGRELSTPTAVAEAVLRLLQEAVSRGGALLLVEDLQWAEPETLVAVDHLLANATDHGAGCVVTLRPDGDPYRVARRWGDTRTARLVELLPLPDADVDRMVRLCLRVDAVPSGLLEFVRDRADGLPFFVEELLAGLLRSGALVPRDGGWQVIERRLRATVPPTLADSVTARFTGLHPRTRRVLQAASLLGRRVAFDVLSEATGLEPDVVLASLREATYAGFLVPDPDDGELRFRHALTREHVAALLLPPERASVARRALDALENAHPGLPGSWCRLGVELAALVGDDRRAARLLVELGGRERRRGALATATTHLERAVGLAGRTEDTLVAREELVITSALAGDVDAALDLGGPTLDQRRTRRDAPDRVLELELALGRALLVGGRYAEAHRHAARAGAVDTPSAAATAAVLRAQIEVSGGDPERARETAGAALHSGTLLPEPACEAWEVIGRAARLHDIDAAEQAFATALDLAERHGLATCRAHALHELGTVDLLTTMRTDRLEQARVAAVETGAAATLAVVDFHIAEALVARQRIVDGRRAAERAIATARRIGSAVLAPALLTLARSFAHELDVDAMEDALARARAANGDQEIEAGEWGRVRAMLALHRAEPVEARAALDRAVPSLRAMPGHHFPHWGLWALLHAVSDGDPGPAAEAATAPGGDTPFNRALVRMAEAVRWGPVDQSAAEARFSAGMADLDRYVDGDWLEHLVGWLVAPSAHRHGWGDPVGWLQAAVRWFADHEQRSLATSCRTWLRDVGGQVPRRGRGTSPVPDDLLALGVSSREMDVLRLLALRLTNSGIAEALTLSPRTVEKHVASLLRKTGSPDRAALIARASTPSAAR